MWSSRAICDMNDSTSRYLFAKTMILPSGQNHNLDLPQWVHRSVRRRQWLWWKNGHRPKAAARRRSWRSNLIDSRLSLIARSTA